MSVRQADGPLRFWVTSHSRGDEGQEWLVDLTEFEENGKCECEHFRYRLAYMLEEGAKPCLQTRCHHILEARDHFTDNVLRLVKKQQRAQMKAAGVSETVANEHAGAPRRGRR